MTIYEEPKLEIVAFDSEDVITTSEGDDIGQGGSED